VLALFCSFVPGGVHAQSDYDVHQFTTELVWRGDQALTMCNGLFVSGRSPEQLMRQELASLLYGNRGGLRPHDPMPLDQASLDYDRKTVAYGIGAAPTAPVMRAAYREGLGCVVMGPEQDFRDVASLPELRLPPFEDDAESVAWPDGDLVGEHALPEGVNAAALEAAGAWLFDREAHGGYEGQITTGVLVVHRGQIVYERYAPGFDRTTRTRTWSTAKSIGAVVVGVGAGKGLVELDAPLPVEWLPARDDPRTDVRTGITLRHVLNMSSGLYPVDNEWQPVRGSHLVYFGGWDGATVPRDRGLLYEPGTVWDYENFDILLGLLALKIGIGDDQAYLEFPHTELFRRIGMRSTVPGVDRYGNYIMSSQVYTNARDLGRLGLLLLQRGRWKGEQILPESWVDFIRTPAPAAAANGRDYGGGWWLPPDARTDVPQDAFASSGSQGNFTIVVPSHDLVVVRRGLDWEDRGLDVRMNRWDVLAEILKAFPAREGGPKGGG
jgi:CubicO group peptidase (beta-lactamase class C family)